MVYAVDLGPLICAGMNQTNKKQNNSKRRTIYSYISVSQIFNNRLFAADRYYPEVEMIIKEFIH